MSAASVDLERNPCAECGVNSTTYAHMIPRRLWVVKCNNCDKQGEPGGFYFEAVEKWNRDNPLPLAPASDAVAQSPSTTTQEEQDVLTVWRWMKAHPRTRVVTQQLHLDRVHIGDGGKSCKAWFRDRDGDDWLHQAADWVRQQESEA